MATVVSQEILEALRKIDTPTICNAIEPLNIRPYTQGFMGMDIRCLFPEMGVMVGYAVTATIDSLTPARVHHRDRRWELFQAIQRSPKPVVLVVKDISPRRSHSCHFGDGLATITQRLGAIGLVTDGGVRDIDGVRALGFHYFAAGLVPAHGNFGFVEVNVPVVVSEVEVKPGDLVHGDVNGVTVFPPEVAQRVVQEAHKVVAREKERAEFAKSPQFTLEELRRRFP